MTDNLFYILDPANFRGTVYSLLRNGVVEFTDGLTLDQYREKKGLPGLVAMPWDVYYKFLCDWQEKNVITPFTEISEEFYYEALECLPPLRWHDLAPDVNVFFCSEMTTGTITACYIKHQGRYFSALKHLHLSDPELLNSFLKDYENISSQH